MAVGSVPSWARVGGRSATASPAYLAHVLRAVLTGPGAEGEPAAARLAADLLVALADAGAADSVAWAMAPRPGAVAVYEVRSFAAGSLDPTDPLGTADPDEALRAARDRSQEPGRTVELVSRDASGLQRCVLSQGGDGLRYRFAELACIDAPLEGAAAVGSAVEEWRAALEEGTAGAAAPLEVEPGAIAQAVLELLVADGRALRTYDVADVLATLIPTPDQVAERVVERLVAHFEGDAAEPDLDR